LNGGTSFIGTVDGSVLYCNAVFQKCVITHYCSSTTQ